MRLLSLLLLALLSLMPGCRDQENKQPKSVAAPKPSRQQTQQVPRKPGCLGCHQAMVPDGNHAFACSRCHGGDNKASEQDRAHTGLISRPAHPDNMARTCGPCHPDQIRQCSGSLHFTLKKAVNRTRQHFGAADTLPSLTRIPEQEGSSAIGLVDDMLRRRCLRCHPYSPGDRYPFVTRGTGCAACHLQFVNGDLKSHRFLARPGDWQCLSCHYGNHVGADYYGQYEHDYNWEYRTPYATSEPFLRPYGVEVHDLAPDIHQQRGLVCIDCHSGSSLAGSGTGPTCQGCHGWQPDRPVPGFARLDTDGDQLVLTGVDGAAHRIPRMRDPAHTRYGDRVACQVCHAQWTFNDTTTYLLRSETDDYDMMERLTVQASSWVERFLDHNLYSDDDEWDPAMPDGITGRKKPGIWYKGFIQRRWEQPIIARDRDGIIKVFRPILDLRLSAVDEEGAVLFDNLKGKDNGLRPYTPHTTGPAGLFYHRRFAPLLEEKEKTPPRP